MAPDTRRCTSARSMLARPTQAPALTRGAPVAAAMIAARASAYTAAAIPGAADFTRLAQSRRKLRSAAQRPAGMTAAPAATSASAAVKMRIVAPISATPRYPSVTTSPRYCPPQVTHPRCPARSSTAPSMRARRIRRRAPKRERSAAVAASAAQVCASRAHVLRLAPGRFPHALLTRKVSPPNAAPRSAPATDAGAATSVVRAGRTATAASNSATRTSPFATISSGRTCRPRRRRSVSLERPGLSPRAAVVARNGSPRVVTLFDQPNVELQRAAEDLRVAAR
jgi:hypothetical protein